MNRQGPITNPHLESEQFRRRATLSLLVILLSLMALMAWYFKLQWFDHQMYTTRSDTNRIKLRPVVPGRGLIFDRNGRLLADNIPAFRLVVTADKVPNMQVMLDQIQRIIPLTPDELDRFNRESHARPRFVPVILKLHMNDEQIARFSLDRWRFPGVELEPYLTRHYVYGDLFAHVIGYVGRVDIKDLRALGQANAAFSQIGKSGLERYYEDVLRGKVGYERVETNVQGRAVRVLGRVLPLPGADLRLAIDADLQRAVVRSFGTYEGAAIAMDPRTGEVLAMVSLPSFDPNLFVNGISRADYKLLSDNPSRPQFNRLVLGGVAPGSTLKPMIALAGLDAGIRQPHDKILSTGMFYLPGISRGWGDAVRTGHGWTDLYKSIAQSVNTYYYQLSLDLGIERFDAYMNHFGLGHPTGIDLRGETGGILPSPSYKMKTRKQSWYTGDTVNVSIGQGDWKVTPLQLVYDVGGIATGYFHRPHLVADQRVGFEHLWEALPQPAPKPISPHPENVSVIREAMREAMRAGGSGYASAAGAPYIIAGKTGTAQVTSHHSIESVDPRTLPLSLRHRALFIGFAPAQTPKIAVAIAVEGGGYGASTAAPIARKIFDAWLLGHLPDNLQPLDTLHGTTAIGITTTDAPSVAEIELGQRECESLGSMPIWLNGSFLSQQSVLPEEVKQDDDANVEVVQ